MKSCTFCKKHTDQLFSHILNDAGNFCAECYLKLHANCGACGESFVPADVQPNVEYQVKANFLRIGEKGYIVCDQCFQTIRECFPERFS